MDSTKSVGYSKNKLPTKGSTDSNAATDKKSIVCFAQFSDSHWCLKKMFYFLRIKI